MFTKGVRGSHGGMARRADPTDLTDDEWRVREPLIPPAKPGGRPRRVAGRAILNAIRYHTSGRPKMSVLEKVVCLADYIEPGRDFPGVQEVRELAEHDLDGALYRSLNNTLMLLIKNNRKLYPLTVEARNDLLKEES